MFKVRFHVCICVQGWDAKKYALKVVWGTSTQNTVSNFLQYLLFQLEDLKQFVIILAVFIISYGVALQAALYPNTSSIWDVLKGILEKPYFQMYGELFNEDFSGINYTSHATFFSLKNNRSTVAGTEIFFQCMLMMWITNARFALGIGSEIKQKSIHGSNQSIEYKVKGEVNT